MEYKYINTKLIDSNGKIFTSPLLIMKISHLNNPILPVAKNYYNKVVINC